MIVLDTDIVSESLRSRPDPHVVSWLDGQIAGSLYLCAPVLAELYDGAGQLPSGRRRNLLLAGIERTAELFNGRVLVFDALAATTYGRVMARRRQQGRPMQQIDGLVAAIASVNRFALATRNVRDFDGVGIEIVNPFET